MNARVLLKGLGLILSLALFGYLFKSSDLGNSVNEAWIDAHIRGHGVEGTLLFLMMGAIFTAVGLPRQIIAFLGGYAFSLLAGTLLAALAALLGCVITFIYARMFGKGLLRAKLGARAGRFDAFIHDNPFSMTLLIRLLPVGNNLLTNLAAGISSIRPGAFFSGSYLGYLPQTLVFALVGSGVNIAPALKVGLAVVLFLVSGLLGAYLYHNHRHGLSIDDEIDAQLGESQQS
jgi:uncharacterized membrane protein YdjX (TVP38/TMEM64 family)